MNHIISTLEIISTNKIIILLSTLVLFIVNNYYQYHYHEYGHVLRIIKNLIEDAANYKTETNTDIFEIQVATFGIFDLLKKKTYSNYFEYLEEKKHKNEYQKIIKDIADGGYNFSINYIKYMKFHIRYIILSFIITTILLPIITSFETEQSLIMCFITIVILVVLALYMFCIVVYAISARWGYGFKKSNSKKKIGMSDYQISLNPIDFKYTNLNEDKKRLQKKYKIVLDIKIYLNHKNYLAIVTPKDKLYRKIIQEFPPNSETESSFLFFLKKNEEN